MLKHILRSPKLCVFGALIIGAPIIAQAAAPASKSVTPPPQEFWDYLTEYSDDKGNVLDPLEYDQILSMKESDDENANDASEVDEPEVLDKPKARNADMKIEKKSSAQASSSAAKGAAL